MLLIVLKYALILGADFVLLSFKTFIVIKEQILQVSLENFACFKSTLLIPYFKDMGFTEKPNCKDAEIDEKRDKKSVPIATEVILKNPNECCRSCQRNKYFAVVQGLFNVALIVLVIILFVMVNNLKSNLDDRLLIYNKRTKRLHEDSVTREYSVGDNMTKNKTKTTDKPPNITKQISLNPLIKTTRDPDLLTELSVLDIEVASNLKVRPGRQNYRKTQQNSEKPIMENLTLANGTQCTCIGQRGPEGPLGRTGRRGKKGKKGPRGDPGLPGPPGPHGLRGKTGKAGPRGDVGPMGMEGAKGEKGDKGVPGRASVTDLPVVHASGYQFLAPLKEMPKGIMNNWDSQGFSITNGKIKFSQGIITIKEYGFYHVYSSVFFQADQAGIDPHLCHYVYFFRKQQTSKDSRKYIILRGFATTPKHTEAGQAFYTTTASGVFRLMPGDQLAIGVDPVHLPLISYAESATYFGAYMI